MSIFSKIFKNPNVLRLEEIQLEVEKINSLEKQIAKLSDSDLKNQTAKFKQDIKKGKSLDDIMPEAFTTVREVAKRTINQRHFDVQMVGAIAMHRGQIAEMKTGEGKTLTATCPLYLNAISGKGSHLVTVNDYLARIHADWMGRIFDFLGMSVGCIGQQNLAMKFNGKRQAKDGDEQLDIQYLEPCSRRQAYQCDILYGTNNEFGFDYLRDNMAQDLNDMVQRDLNYAIVDEIDSILIDEARTPLIISAPDAESTDKYHQFSQIAAQLKENEHYNVDEKMKSASLTEQGIEYVEKILGVENIYTERGISEVHHIEQAVKARGLFKRDKDYVVKDGQIIIVDEFTGRLMHGRRFSEGLHQAIEAKEGVPVQRESKTMATISLQNYFRLYDKLSGMTGTANTEAEEFHKIYNLEVTIVPTNRPMIRKDYNDRIYKNEDGKIKALIKEVKKRSKAGQPVLIGTVSIEKNEMIADELSREGVNCQVLNAKHHEKEAHIIAQAGKLGAVTVATNMAGRGVDIILGGHPYDENEYQKVKQAGGLCVLGTERHESRRIDNQLRGRSGRQGDPGASIFFLSMDDDLMRVFGSDRMKSIMNTLRMPDDMPIDNKMISRSIEQAQKKVEGFNFDSRKHLLEYDDVMNKQRETIYRKRKAILEAKDTKQEMLDSIGRELIEIVKVHTAGSDEENWNLQEVYENVAAIFPVKEEEKVKISDIDEEAGDSRQDNMARAKLMNYLKKLAVIKYNELEERVNMYKTPEMKDLPMRQVERGMMLRAIDMLWVEHLETMTYLRAGIGLRGYGQKDPLVEYKREAYNMFRQLLTQIDKQLAFSIFKVGMADPSFVDARPHPKKHLNFIAPSKESPETSPLEQNPKTKERKDDNLIDDKTHYDGEKVGRNDPCPCGSGKKFKKCHGK